MMRDVLRAQRSWLVVLLVSLFFLQACAQRAEIYLTSHDVVEGIRTNYESGLETLPLSLQRHYAQRLYRMTGDERFLPYQLRHAEQLIQTFNRDVAGVLAQPDYVLSRDRLISERRPLRTERQRQRALLLDAYPGMSFSTDLAFRLVQLEYYGLLDQLPHEEVALLKQVLEQADFESFLLSDAAIRHYAAQAANQVWFLYQLDVVDLRDAFMQRFQEVYPLSSDHGLSSSEFHNKVYGLTHIVIAASRYYQDLLPDDEFTWITDYFIDQTPLLLETATEDILAEVGISLALTGQADHPSVALIRERLIAAYDPEHMMIPSPSGGTNFAQGEHRNVLAVMLLIWPDELFTGPYIELSSLKIER
ncbi:MAG: DUF3541 domain-containing protein [Oceanospirillales bacterium]|nr:MAG: DUF3541 domain-containing protein [Oceanospirillales bacterium]